MVLIIMPKVVWRKDPCALDGVQVLLQSYRGEAGMDFQWSRNGPMFQEPRWISCYSNQHLILLVGEGNFSFSASLGNAFGAATNMVATSLDSKGMHSCLAFERYPWLACVSEFVIGDCCEQTSCWRNTGGRPSGTRLAWCTAEHWSSTVSMPARWPSNRSISWAGFTCRSSITSSSISPTLASLGKKAMPVC